MRWATRRTPWTAAVGAVVAAVLLLVPVGGGPVAEAQDRPPSPSTNPIEPTGRAVCNLAFTLAGAIGLANFVVPPDAPLGPNEVISALRPVLNGCVGIFPPAPPRQCFTSELYPSTGLPISLPDPVAIVTEQLEAVAAALDPLGLALAGPLGDVFRDALRCTDLAPPGGDPPEEGGAGRR